MRTFVVVHTKGEQSVVARVGAAQVSESEGGTKRPGHSLIPKFTPWIGGGVIESKSWKSGTIMFRIIKFWPATLH